ncbi:MAG: hypothetical protein ACOYOK_03205 [Pseudobdellovibrionaceae bacterium]
MKTTSVTDKSYITLKIIWLALLASNALYGFSGYQITKNHTPLEGEVILPFYQHTMFQPLLISSIVILGLAFFLPKLIFKLSRNAMVQTGQNSIEKNHLALLILRLALLEAIGILGLLLSMFSHDFTAFLAFISVTILGFIISFPNEQNLKRITGDI